MKKFAPLLLVLFLIGCVATGYKTLYTTEATVNSAYGAYLSLVVQGKVKTNNVPKISQQYNAFQTAMTNAIMAAQFDLKQPPNPDVSKKAMVLINSIAAEKGSK